MGRFPVRRAIYLLAAAVGLYFVWPSLLTLFAAAPSLRAIDWLWFVLMGILEAASFAAYWALMRVTIGECRWSVVALVQLSSNAITRIVPGGAASGGPMSYRLLTGAGSPRGRTATGLTVTTLLSVAVLIALSVLALPTILSGVTIERSLLLAMQFGAVLFVLIIAAGALFLFSDPPLVLAARTFQWFRDRLPRRPARSIDLPARVLNERDLIRTVLGDRWWEALPYAAANWLLDYAALLAALAAVGAHPRPSLVLVAYVVAALLGMVPITPGGLGFVEAGLTATLTLSGIGAAEATAATLAYRLVSFWLPIPIGFAALLVYNRRFDGKLRDEGQNGRREAAGQDKP